jgi:hypothetical protein
MIKADLSFRQVFIDIGVRKINSRIGVAHYGALVVLHKETLGGEIGPSNREAHGEAKLNRWN